jgi:plastocyanin
MNRISILGLALLLFAVPILASCQPVAQAAPPPEPRELTVTAGAGQDVVAVNAFFPASVHVRAGDTVTWKIGSDEPHTASFLSGGPLVPDAAPIPGGGPTDIMLNPDLAFPTRAQDAPVETYDGTGYRNSGLLSNGKVVPPLESYSLTFDKPGVYQYICLIHPATMKGEIIVEPAKAVDVPTQEEIDAQAMAEVEPLLAMADEARAASTNSDLVRTEPGPDGSTIWHVPAGITADDPRVEIYDFFPKDLDVKQGDTVIWTSTFFHEVIFHPGQPAPEFIMPEPQAEGPPRLVVNPDVAFPAKPSGDFDGTGLYSSGIIGTPLAQRPGGTTFAMTFTEPGSYDYVCATHLPLGMQGNINVVAQ